MAIILRAIREEDLEMIMNWRMSESVTKYMNTNPKLTIEGQKKWLSSIKENESVKYWLIEVDNIPAGVINLAEIDWENKTSSWGYYIGNEKLRSLRLAISLEMSLYDYCFDILGLLEVHNEVLKLNDGVWKLHTACGCKIVKEGSGEVEKDGTLYDVVHLSIEKNEWLRLRPNKKYEKINFDITDEFAWGGVHHLGVAVYDLAASIKDYSQLGWALSGEIINDKDRDVTLAFLRRIDSNAAIELVCPINEKSPVAHTLRERKNVAMLYHVCYEVNDIEKAIGGLKKSGYFLADKIKPAVAFDGRRVAFMLNHGVGLIELLEKA